MRDEERFKLLHGPYVTPAVQLGDQLECEGRGIVVVQAWSGGIIPWPCVRRGGRPSFILCGDLVRAIQVESSLAVQHWWSVSGHTVCQWRRTLDVNPINEGTQRLYRDYKPETLTDERVARGLTKAHSVNVRLKAQQTRRERGTQANLKPWAPDEEELLGTMPDAQLAQRIGRSAHNIGIHRRRLGIAAYSQKYSTNARSGRDTVALDAAKLKARRFALGLLQKEVAQRTPMHFIMYSSLETGTRQRVLRETLHKLARAMECSPDDLLHQDDR